jgi:hypothetical protein
MKMTRRILVAATAVGAALTFTAAVQAQAPGPVRIGSR